jgi:Domain of unknown function (DUF4169)
MGDIINLRQARKAASRQAAEQKAQENRVIFGRTKAQKRAENDQKAREARLLDGAALVPQKTDPEA